MSPQLQLLFEGESGCLMCRVPSVSDCAKVTDWAHENIPETDLAEDGYENDVHTTVAYGFTPDVKPQEVSEVVSEVCPDGVDIRLGEMSFFDTDPEHDVLKVDIESDGLQALHYALRKAFGKRLVISYPEYHPHLTIAYLKKGKCREFLGNASFAGWTIKCKQFTYSTPSMAANYTLPLEGDGAPVVSDVKESVSDLLEVATFHPDIMNDIHAFENGEQNEKQTIAMFKKLVKLGMKLTGPYGRMAQNLIRKGLIEPPKEKKQDLVKKSVTAESLLNEIADNPPVMPDSFFRKLSPQEDAEFRQWAREHRAELEKREANGTLGVLHPDVRSEFRKMKGGTAESMGVELVTSLLEWGEFEDEADQGPDAYKEMQSDIESGDCYVIQDSRGAGVDLVSGCKIMGHYEDMDEAVRALVEHANAEKFWPSVYHVNERGNTDVLIVNYDEGTYKMGQGWV